MTKQFIKVSQLRDKMTDKPTHPQITDFFNGNDNSVTEKQIKEMIAIDKAEYAARLSFLTGKLREAKQKQ